MEETKRVTGVEEFKAVSHPLRVRLLGHLRAHGPATATELAKRFETDTGSTSYHLRKLAQFGFVDETSDPEPGGHPRTRRWRAVHKTTSWSNADFAGSPEERAVAGVMRRRQLEVLMRDLDSFESRIGELPREWAEACGIQGDQLFKLTAASLKRLLERFEEELEEAAARDEADPDAQVVAVYAAAFPRDDQ
jgi:DNA-binding transcriptional ArsR family regulator